MVLSDILSITAQLLNTYAVNAKHIYWVVKRIYWSPILWLNHSCLGAICSIGGLAPMPPCPRP